jgi:hypothetical protein
VLRKEGGALVVDALVAHVLHELAAVGSEAGHADANVGVDGEELLLVGGEVVGSAL